MLGRRCYVPLFTKDTIVETDPVFQRLLSCQKKDNWLVGNQSAEALKGSTPEKNIIVITTVRTQLTV